MTGKALQTIPDHFALILLLLAGCATEGDVTPATDCSASELLGSWYQSSNNETLTFESGCRLTSTFCATQGRIDHFDNTARTLELNGLTTAYPGTPGCDTDTLRTCSYSATGFSAGSTLTLTCTPQGGGTYTKL